MTDRIHDDVAEGDTLVNGGVDREERQSRRASRRAARRAPSSTRNPFGDDELGRALAAVDWAATPLGPPDTWSYGLTAALTMLLESRFPMWMAWGSEFTFFCNDAYRRDTLGGKFPWALGRPAREVWTEAWPDSGPRMTSVLTRGVPTWDEDLMLFLDRSGYLQETYHTFSYSPLRDDDGAVAGVLCVASEDTERVVSERRMTTLRELGSDPNVIHDDAETLAFAAEQMRRNRYDLPFTAVYLFDGSGAVTLGASTGFTHGHPLAPPTIAADDDTIPWAGCRNWAQQPPPPGGLTIDLTGVDQVPAGEWPEPPVQALAVPLRLAGGTPLGFLVVGLNRYRELDDPYRDFITLVAGHISTGLAAARSFQDQQRRADELTALDRAKTDFFSNISHEFRAPLTLIMGPVDELLSRGDALAADVRTELTMVHRNGLRLSKLVASLLDFSRIEAGWMQASYTPVDLAALTTELASVFRAVMDQAGLQLVVDCRPLTSPVYVDLDMWEKVMFNLLSNAVKFTFDGAVTVSVRQDGEHAMVSVSDTGIGIPPAELPHLFDRFHRVRSVRARTIEGAGIGLALVQELVGFHGGSITVDSREGQGSTFTIRLPFGRDHLPADARADIGDTGPDIRPDTGPGPGEGRAPVKTGLDGDDVVELTTWIESSDGTNALAPLPSDADGLSGGTVRVLIADDNPDMRDFLVRAMTRAGYHAVAVGDGKSALDAVHRELPDIVVADVAMPRMDGLSLLQLLRNDSRTAAIPVVLLSARADEDASLAGLQAGADDYLVKPFGTAELLARVRNSVKLARLRNHHARWRDALVDSLHEGFFVSDESGAIIEINAAFTEIVGYDTSGLPYRPPFPWAPDAGIDEEGHRLFDEAYGALKRRERRHQTVPLVHRDGREVWTTMTFSPADDPATDRHVMVGTLRDVTAEHFMVQRDAARASLIGRLAQALDVEQALAEALAELRDIWHAARVSAAIFRVGDEPRIVSVGDNRTWRQLPSKQRRRLAGLRRHPELTPLVDEDGCGIRMEHPAGELVVWIHLDGRRRFTREDRLLLSLLAGHMAQALARTNQVDQQRRTALALQRAVLGPAQLPDGFAVRYEPASPPLEIGGDWYDTVTLSNGRIGIVVGDCVGHGLRAAAVMGQLRSACRALLLQDASPAAVLTAMDRFAAGVPGAVCTTVFCAVLDPASGELCYASAGHPPCIVVGPGGSAELLEEGRSLPLAVRQGEERPEATANIAARSTLLVYTDGLVERRKQSLATGIARLRDVLVSGANEPLESLADDLKASLAPPRGYDDDVALLLYRHPGPLDLDFPAEAVELAPMRDALRAWLAKSGADAATTQAVLVAVGEACSNSIEHGYRDTAGGMVRLRADASADRLRLVVCDRGAWRVPSPDPRRGRGVALMRGLMDHVEITGDSTGTTVEMIVRM